MASSGGVDKAPTGLGVQGDGSGDIGVGTSPVAGESSFTGNTSIPEGQQQE